MTLTIDAPAIFKPLYKPSRYKGLHGGNTATEAQEERQMEAEVRRLATGYRIRIKQPRRHAIEVSYRVRNSVNASGRKHDVATFHGERLLRRARL
jgi:hypothetical protein